jgi:hypothetical protein
VALLDDELTVGRGALSAPAAHVLLCQAPGEDVALTGKRPPRLDRDAQKDSRDCRILRAMDRQGCPVWLP